MSQLWHLTLVIPTYNRNHYLSRCLWYHAHFPFGEIIVADSSPEEKKVVNRETVAKIREIFGANVRYLEYEPETEKYGGDIYRKWGDAVQHVETEYSQIVTDKEFLIPTVLDEIITVLSREPEYVGGHGKEYAFTNTEASLIPRHPKRCSETSDSPIKRFDDSIVNVPGFSNSLLLATMRTTVLKNIYSQLRIHEFRDIRYGEIFLGYVGHILGKTISLNETTYRIRDETYIRRDRTIQKGKFWCKSGESSTSRYPTFEEYKKSGVADVFYQKLEHALQEAFTTNTDLSEQEISTYLSMRKQLLYTVLTSISSSESIMHKCSVIAPLWYNLPLPVKRTMQNVGNKLFNIRLPLEREGDLGIMPETREEQIITQIINDTIHHHTSDSPITM